MLFRSGLYWNCDSNYSGDGLHLSPSGEAKSGSMIFNTFIQDSTAKYWLVAPTPTSSVFTSNNPMPINCYPNPASKEVRIYFEHTLPEVSISISTSDGVIIAKEQIQTSSPELSLPLDLSSGWYLFSLSSADRQVTAKIQINR